MHRACSLAGPGFDANTDGSHMVTCNCLFLAWRVRCPVRHRLGQLVTQTLVQECGGTVWQSYTECKRWGPASILATSLPAREKERQREKGSIISWRQAVSLLRLSPLTLVWPFFSGPLIFPICQNTSSHPCLLIGLLVRDDLILYLPPHPVLPPNTLSILGTSNYKIRNFNILHFSMFAMWQCKIKMEKESTNIKMT